jgi:hydrogenase/urease accessory protein HupE
MNRFCCTLLLTLLAFSSFAQAHELSFSHIKLQLEQNRVAIQMPVADLARQLSNTNPSQLLQPATLERLKPQILGLLQKRFSIRAGHTTVRLTAEQLEPLPAQKEVRATLQIVGGIQNQTLQIDVALFPDNNLHKTFLDVYNGATLESQLIFDAQKTSVAYQPSSQQTTLEVVGSFTLEGIRHIFGGPDHILFVIGLLLIGGTMLQLLKIVSAFTLAHSITLALATLHILNPSARFIEPAIAASIVFVGVHGLLNKSKRDHRTLFAFGFGFIHGFGFANALAQMQLPQGALVWSLFSFNVGVEFGQACIVLLVAPLLALVRVRSPKNSHHLIQFMSVGVILAGAYWFIERVVTI